MNLDFLKTVEVAQEVKQTARVSVDKIPEGLALRVFASGKVYPSKELVEKYSLEYMPKTASASGNGLDIFKSSDWAGFPVDPNTPRGYLFVAAVPKTESKVSLFASCGFDDAGNPKASVTTQGGGSFGKELVEMVESVFGITIEKGEYVDLTVNTDIAIPSNTGFYYIPKVTKKKDGTIVPDAVRRENVVINPLMLEVEVCEESTAEDIDTSSDVAMKEEIEASAGVQLNEKVFTPDAAPEVNPFENTESAPEMPGMPDIPESGAMSV